MRLSMFTMLWQQGELKAWLQSNALIVSKLTCGSDVMSAYSSSEKKKTLANLHGSQIGNVIKSGSKTSISQIAWTQETQDNRRSLGCSKKKLNRGNVAKRFLRGFKLISCTAADYKFLFRTSKCFCKIEITVWIRRSKSQRSVKD